jgi:hypothetical protein
MSSKRLVKVSIFLIVALASTVWFGCTSAVDTRPEDMSGTGGAVMDRKPLKDPPSYRQFADSLEYYEEELGMKFFRNKKGRFVPYATSGWKNFTIADRLNECIYDVAMKDLIVYRHLQGRMKGLIEMDITRAGCGIKYPDVDYVAMDKVTLMEGSVISPNLQDLTKGGLSLTRGAAFLQRVLQLPWRVDSLEGGLEQAVSKVGTEIRNPLDITYGDVVFFTEHYGERNVGLYVDYGLIVYNSSFRASARKMDSSINYRIYRIYTGFNLARYKVHENKFLRDFVGQPD